ncbi:MAG: histidinol dehydrogenase [Clostridiales bacterium]|jgi:histidinol dehydrogenase|nr:histidinol dehydrogenase [Clostridiales bacterium]
MLRTFSGAAFRRQFTRRGFDDYPGILASVRDIIADVRKNGDRAVLAYTETFDKTTLTALQVSEEEFALAEAAVEPAVRESLARAAANIASFHKKQLRNSWLEHYEDGVVLGQRVTPVDRAGVYVPGGGAAYPSSVLMTVIPARVAGVRDVILVTPPRPDGSINPYTLVAANIAGADAVYKCGGAQAVAALAYGTETIPAADKIVGPGNLFVTLAKREVSGVVGIDMLAGPSEVLVLADDSARADFVAADLLSQAEHDPLAAAYCITTSQRLAEELVAELTKQCTALDRCDVAQKSLQNQGALVLVDSLDEGLEIVNILAPEHLELHLTEPWAVLEKIRNAGAIFVGAYTPEPVGDYWAGPSHVLPTSGAGRFSSPLSVDDFIKKSSVICYPPEALLHSAAEIESLARIEGLTAHGRAVKIRREHLEKQNINPDS